MIHRIILMGTPEYAVPFLKALVENGRAPTLTVSQPDRQAGRKALLQPSAVKRAALELGLTVAQPETVNDGRFIEELRSLRPDLFVVVAFGQILSRALLDVPRLGTINVHPSLLPKYRGATPLQEAILNGDEHTGVTIMLMDEKMDHGPILLQQTVKLSDDETLASLQKKTTTVGIPLLLKAIDLIEAGTAQPKPQDHSAATFTRELTRESGKLDFSKNAQELERSLRALEPWPGTWFSWRGKRIKLLNAQISEESGPHEVGGDFFIGKDGSLHLSCADGSLNIETLQIEGKKPMTSEAFINGYLKRRPV